MPIYEYVCQECQHELEVLQKVSDPLLVECPNCSRPGLQKKVSAAGFRLKGGGWYETDFKSDKRKNLAGDGGGSGGASGGDSAGKGSSATGSASSSSGASPSSGTSSTGGTGTAGS